MPYSAVEREFWRLVNSMDDEVSSLILFLLTGIGGSHRCDERASIHVGGSHWIVVGCLPTS